MSDNDILAEYIRKNRPEIERSLDFIFYRLGVRLSEAIKPKLNGLENINNVQTEIEHQELDINDTSD